MSDIFTTELNGDAEDVAVANDIRFRMAQILVFEMDEGTREAEEAAEAYADSPDKGTARFYQIKARGTVERAKKSGRA